MKLFKSSLFLSLVLLFSLTDIHAQSREVNYVKGDILLQTTPEGNITQIVNDLKIIDGIETNVELIKEVSKPMRIWLVHFSHQAINQQRMLNEVYMHSQVSVAQVNHILEHRSTVPNDPQFNSQWQYVNTGQSGGTVDADIDADSAWTISTGGYTPQGDTIVVCIIDNGIDLSHADLTPNRWVNHAEIPNNGIDDDNNGFIDDYLGWDTGSGNDNIDVGSHGTAVAGIIGAKGNDSLGVTGINWDIKMMIVRGGTGVESEVLEAYSYPLVMRQKYNATNGVEGAYVVATNASWGVDNGQPANAPLWCAMYDTLGHYGILNAGAGPNANVDVDVVGDLPTACPSEYLITLTNMNHFDQKVTQAPVGPMTIDLGAPGAGTWTTDQGNAYTSFGGTSGATPHVTGTIGLLYSVDCPGFATFSKNRPELAAKFTKDYILKNVDANADLANVTTTGGRLNLYKAMKNAYDSCVVPDCLPPYDVLASNVIDTSALLSWSAVTDTTTTFNLRWRVLGSTTWNIVSDTLTSYLFTNLTACTVYEVSIEVICNNMTAYSDLYTFKTDGCCEAPSGLDAIALSDTSAFLSWNSILAANAYIINYKEVGTNIWRIDTVNTNSHTLMDLQKCKQYEFSIQTICDTGSTLSSDEYIFAAGCGNCTVASYCTSTGNTFYEYIESVSIGNTNYTTGDNGGYYQHDGIAFTLDKTTHTTTVTPGFNQGPDNEAIRIWIDYNQNGNFDDAGELVLDSPVSSNPANGNFTIPTSAMTGITRMRILMRFNQAGTSCENPFDGETEDYCVEITNNTSALCETPLGLDTTSTTTTSIDLEWSAVATASEYLVRYRQSNTNSWSFVNSSTTNSALTGLLQCNLYEIQVASICSVTSDSSAFSSSIFINTQCPTNTSNVLPTLVDVKVFPNPMASQFNVGMRLIENQEVTIQLLNVNGQLIEEKQLGYLNGEQVIPVVPSQSLVRGTYIVKIIAGNDIIVRRIVK